MRRAIQPDEFPFLDASRYTFSLGILGAGYAWLSGHTGAQYEAERNEVVLGPDLEAQMRVAYAKVDTILEAAGLGHEDIVRVAEYIPSRFRAEYDREGDRIRGTLLKASPFLVTVPVERLLRADARIEVEVIARARGAESSLTYVGAAGADAMAQASAALQSEGRSWGHVVRALQVSNAQQPWPDDLNASGNWLGLAEGEGASPIVDLIVGAETVEPVVVEGRTMGARVGPVAYLSSCAGADTSDLGTELRANYEWVARAVEAAGYTLDDVVKTVEFITPEALDGYRATAEIRREVFSQPFPAATGVILPSLPGGARVLVEAIVAAG